MTYGQYGGPNHQATGELLPNTEPYPPRSFEERRLTAILERIETRLKAIEEKLAATTAV